MEKTENLYEITKKPKGLHEFIINSVYIKLDIEKNNILVFSLINKDKKEFHKPITSLSKGKMKKEVIETVRELVRYNKKNLFDDSEIEIFLKKIKKLLKRYYAKINRYKKYKGFPNIGKNDDWTLDPIYNEPDIEEDRYDEEDEILN